MSTESDPKDEPAELICSRCDEPVDVYGAKSLIREPFVCVACLDPRHREESDG